MKNNLKLKSLASKVYLNAPVTVGFVILCLIVLGLDALTKQKSTVTLFCVYRASLLNPLTYLRFFTHVLGHSSFSHLAGNATLLLVLGPGLEQRYSSKGLIAAIAVTAFLSGLAEFIFFPNTMLLGASGIVFMMIILSSATGNKNGAVPITLILVFAIYVGRELIDAFTVSDNISQTAHIIGGICGALIGLKLKPRAY